MHCFLQLALIARCWFGPWMGGMIVPIPKAYNSLECKLGLPVIQSLCMGSNRHKNNHLSGTLAGDYLGWLNDSVDNV